MEPIPRDDADQYPGEYENVQPSDSGKKLGSFQFSRESEAGYLSLSSTQGDPGYSYENVEPSASGPGKTFTIFSVGSEFRESKPSSFGSESKHSHHAPALDVLECSGTPPTGDESGKLKPHSTESDTGNSKLPPTERDAGNSKLPSAEGESGKGIVQKMKKLILRRKQPEGFSSKSNQDEEGPRTENADKETTGAVKRADYEKETWTVSSIPTKESMELRDHDEDEAGYLRPVTLKRALKPPLLQQKPKPMATQSHHNNEKCPSSGLRGWSEDSMNEREAIPTPCEDDRQQWDQALQPSPVQIPLDDRMHIPTPIIPNRPAPLRHTAPPSSSSTSSNSPIHQHDKMPHQTKPYRAHPYQNVGKMNSQVIDVYVPIDRCAVGSVEFVDQDGAIVIAKSELYPYLRENDQVLHIGQINVEHQGAHFAFLCFTNGTEDKVHVTIKR